MTYCYACGQPHPDLSTQQRTRPRWPGMEDVEVDGWVPVSRDVLLPGERVMLDPQDMAEYRVCQNTHWYERGGHSWLATEKYPMWVRKDGVK